MIYCYNGFYACDVENENIKYALIAFDHSYKNDNDFFTLDLFETYDKADKYYKRYCNSLMKKYKFCKIEISKLQTLNELEKEKQ